MNLKWLGIFRKTAAILLILCGAAPVATHAAPGNAAIIASVTRRDLRPLPGVALRLTGPADREVLTDENGRGAFFDLPAAGPVTITPARSGFRFEPGQLTIPAPGNSVAFAAVPATTDLALSMASDNPAPPVGGIVNIVITLRNLGVEAATDVAVGFSLLPGLAFEGSQAMQGRLEYQTYQTLWKLPQLDPGAAAEVRVRARATLPNANVLTVAVVEEVDQTDANPLDNSAELITRPTAAVARLSLAMTIDPAPVKAGEIIPVRLTLRNEGPNDATQVAIRSYLPPGASFTSPAEGLNSSSVVLSRLAPGAQVVLAGAMRVRIPGTFPLIANVTYMEQQLQAGAEWPEARGTFTVLPAFARISLLAFTDPPNPRVGEDITVTYVAKNEGPDAVTGLKPFTRADSRLGLGLTSDPNPAPPPLPGPFQFGDVLPVGAYTYSTYRYSVQAAGDLTNYFTVEYQDQLIPNAADHPELTVVIKTLPADVGLSMDATPKEITVRSGDPVNIEFPVHNAGPQAAHGVMIDYKSPGLAGTELDEVVHADRVERPGMFGYIDVVNPGETVLLRKHFTAVKPGSYTNAAQLTASQERPDLLLPVASETIRLRVLPGPPPALGITVAVDQAQVNVGEYAIFITTVTNHAAQPAFNVFVRETDSLDAGFGFETVRSYGPTGDDRISSASERIIPRIEPGGSYSMSRTMRLRKPVTINYVAKIAAAGGLSEFELPTWVATTQVTGLQVTSDIAPTAVADRTEVKNGDLVNFVIKERNLSPHTASHVGIFGGLGAGFQMLRLDLGSYGYYFDWQRPRDLQSGSAPLTQWTEIRSQEAVYSFFSAYTVGAGQFTMSAQLSELEQFDGQPANDLTQVQINSAPAAGRISLRQSTLWPNASVGRIVPFVTEIRNEGPDRVTGLTLLETTSPNLELTYDARVSGISGNVVTSFLDSLVRLPPLEPGQNFIWQRTYSARQLGNAWRRVQVAGFDQTPLAPLPESVAAINVEPASADLDVQFLEAPTLAAASIPVLVGVRVRNLGPGVATGVKIAVVAPPEALSTGPFGYGPRAGIDLLGWNTFQTQLLPGESATVGVYATPAREGRVTLQAVVQQSDQTDPNPINDTVSLALDVGPAPAIPPILRVRKVRTDFFDQSAITEIEIDQAALNSLAPLTIFSLEASSNLRDWIPLKDVGFMPLAPVTFTDHAAPEVKNRIYRLRRH